MAIAIISETFKNVFYLYSSDFIFLRLPFIKHFIAILLLLLIQFILYINLLQLFSLNYYFLSTIFIIWIYH